MTERHLSPVDITLEGIGHVLRDRRLEVPAFQRGYSWELEEVGEFWWDLRAAFEAVNPEYFLGTIVVTRQSSARQATIIDGQQRLTTTSLLFVALRNEFLRRGDASRAQVIEHQYITTLDLGSGKQTTRLLLNPADQLRYHEIVDVRAPAGDSRGSAGHSEGRIARALAFLEEQVSLEAKNAGPHWADTLIRWIDFLERRARVITVVVASESDAFLIFETLNARGRELTVADLLKSYLFGLAANDLPLLENNWASALRALETSATEEIFTTYVRHLWSSMEGATRERELYGRLKAAITSKPAALAFGAELDRAAPAYAALLNSDQPFWASRRAVQPLAETLLRLGLEQNRPLLLAAMLRFHERELADLIRAVIGWSIRGLVVGGIGGGTTERAYAEAAVAVTEGRARNAQEVFESVSSVVPTDDVFLQTFAVRRITRTRLAKYLLVALSQMEDGVDDAVVVSDALDSEYRLESVLPRNARAESWPNFSSDDISEWIFRLGNLYVLRDEGSPRPLSSLIDAPRWSPDVIAERQAELARMAALLWRRQP